MTRPLRLEFRGVLYHITSRGDGQEAIYRDDADRALCLEVLAKDLSEIPTAQRRRVAKPLDYYARQHRDRNEAIQRAYASGGHGLKAIGEHFGLHYSRVSRIEAAGEKAKGKTSLFFFASSR